jgi:site-specific recombinase XerC
LGCSALHDLVAGAASRCGQSSFDVTDLASARDFGRSDLCLLEAAGLRLGDLRPDGTLEVMGKGAKERIVPVGGTARTAIVRYMGQRGAGAPDEPLFLGPRC